MTNRHGEFIWYELMTSDADSAAGFYGNVVGWRTRDAESGPGSYRIFSSPHGEVGGLFILAGEAAASGMRPAWVGYLGVDDVDASVAQILAAGGSQHMPPTDIPGVGRLAMMADPQGVAFYVMRGAMDARSDAFAPSRVGHCHWNELTTTDPEAALAFYSNCFGWTKGDAMPMGEMGDYQFFHHHGEMLGAVMKVQPDSPRARWVFYFGVDEIDAAVERIKLNGGAVHFGPMEVPGDAFAILATDPQGAMFGLVADGPRKGGD